MRPTLLLLTLLSVALAVPAVALAGGEATVSVEVVTGTKGGSGTDSSVSKHAGTLANFAGFGGWKSGGSFRLKSELGKTSSKDVGSRKFQAQLVELTADRAKVKLSVVDPKGKASTVTSSFKKGAQTVVTSKSSDGKELHVFVVRVSF